MIYLNNNKLAYVPVPKNACTAIKYFLYKLQNGREFQRFEAGHRKFQIHNVMSTSLYEKWSSMDIFGEIEKSNTFIFAVVRDPLSRFLSCYKSRVLIHNDIGINKWACKKCKEQNLPVKPDINTFVENLSFYRKSSLSINHHTEPQVSFLGHDVNFYSKIYPIDKVSSELWNDLREVLGEIELPCIKKEHGGGSFNDFTDQLNSENTEKIQQIYAADYKFLEGIF